MPERRAAPAGTQRAGCSRRLLWGWLLAIALLAALVVGIVAPLRPSGFALQFVWQARNFGEIMHLWSPDELARYRSHLPFDSVLLLLYGGFGYCCVRCLKMYAALGQRWRRLAASLLPLAALCHAVENAFHWWLTEMPRFGVPELYVYSACSAALKWLAVFAFLALSLWAWGRDTEAASRPV